MGQIPRNKAEQGEEQMDPSDKKQNKNKKTIDEQVESYITKLKKRKLKLL